MKRSISVYDDAQILGMYIDWFNNFLTLQRFSDYYGISDTFAEYIITEGRKILNRQLYGGSKLHQAVIVRSK